MDRRVLILAVCVASLSGATGCQGYNFNPVGHCLIQPGSERVAISPIATSDVLFVVDDSGSMAGEQAALGTEFPRFLDVLARANKDRVTSDPPQEAVDFHIAVTTTATYSNDPPVNGSFCRNDCPGATGSNVCCLNDSGGTPSSAQPPLCASDADCATGSGFTCRNDCIGLGDVSFYTSMACCNPTTKAPQPIPCGSPGEACGIFDRFYYDDGLCDPSYSTGAPYPGGRFVADPANAGSPTPEAQGKVLRFTKALPWNTWDWSGPAPGSWGATAVSLQNLAAAFNNNVQVGTCGSPQEQGLEAARRAIKAQLGQEGLSQPGVGAGDWLHANSKLVVVWVTDEDDCSAPYSAADGVIFPLTRDGCVADAALPAAEQRQFQISEYADYFTSLGRPFGAAFIASANNGCIDQGCTPLLCTAPPEACCPPGSPGCTPPPGTCGGQGVPTRYLQLAAELRNRKVEVVTGSVCDAFGDSLGRIARIVKPPDGLFLPTPPAAREVAILRITGPDGKTRKTCSPPAPPPATPVTVGDNAAAQAYLNTVVGTYDWWFTATAQQVTAYEKLPTQPSRFVFINHATRACEADAQESYSADYIGRLPSPRNPDCPEDPSVECQGGCADAQECLDALGGQPGDWQCFGYVEGPPEIRGTCLCN